MKILVIGGTGFIGVPLVKKLVNFGHEVTVACRGYTQADLPDSVQRLLVHCKDTLKFNKLFGHTSFDAIYDLTAYSSRNIIQIGKTFTNRVRYIMVSTAAVYGIGRVDAMSEQTPFARIPWHEYGYNKWMAEQEISNFPQLDCVVVRPCVVYGPRDSQTHRASHFFRRIVHRVPIIIPGKAETRNNYIYVEDLAQLLFLCLQAPTGTIVNAGGPEIFTWPMYLSTVAKVVNMPVPPCKYLDMSLDRYRQWEHCKFLQFHHNAFEHFVLDITSAKKLGWNPKYTLEQGLKETWEWLEKQGRNILQEDVQALQAEKQWIFKTFGL